MSCVSGKIINVALCPAGAGGPGELAAEAERVLAPFVPRMTRYFFEGAFSKN